MTRGRTRNFDYDEALDAAVLVFWRDGYSSASLSTLCESMGLNKPSLYAAFGDKQQLFQLALARYEAAYTAPLLNQFLAKDDVTEAICEFWHGIVDLTTSPKHPKGCLVVCSTVDRSAASTTPEIQAAVSQITQHWTDAIQQRIQAAQKTSPALAARDARWLARYVMTVLTGLALTARSGVHRKALHATVDEAASGLPA